MACKTPLKNNYWPAKWRFIRYEVVYIPSHCHTYIVAVFFLAERFCIVYCCIELPILHYICFAWITTCTSNCKHLPRGLKVPPGCTTRNKISDTWINNTLPCISFAFPPAFTSTQPATAAEINHRQMWLGSGALTRYANRKPIEIHPALDTHTFRIYETGVSGDFVWIVFFTPFRTR